MLSGRVALVTGSTRGIGLSILRALAQEGADVVMHGIDCHETRLDATAERIQSENSIKLHRSNADLMQPREIQEMIQKVQTDFGKLDILVSEALQHFMCNSIWLAGEQCWNSVCCSSGGVSR